jgi:hypothetical protein
VAFQRFSGTLTNEARGLRSTGQKVDLLQVEINRIILGRITANEDSKHSAILEAISLGIAGAI